MPAKKVSHNYSITIFGFGTRYHDKFFPGFQSLWIFATLTYHVKVHPRAEQEGARPGHHKV
jgi:hypothetical protein